MAALVFQAHHEALHATVTDRQMGAQIADQAAQREQQGGLGLHLVAQFHPRIEMIRWLVALQRVVGLPIQPGQVIEQRLAEAAPQRSGRQRAQAAQVAHAHPLQAHAGIAGQGRASHRHAIEQARQGLRLHHRHAVAQAGQHPRRARRRRQRDAVAETQLVQFVAQASLELRPRPQQAEAGAGLQHDGRRPLRTHQRAVPVRPGGEEALPARHLAGIVLDHRELRQQRVRGDQAHAR